MRVLVNGVRLFFDVDGASLVPDARTMREKPTLVLLHGGPGFDHSIYKPRFSALTDIAQVIFLDQRGNGRSDPGPREAWTLAQWGDDVRAFCEVLGIARPIVLGVSFGGMVALAYATRHPAHAGKLILVSTEAAGGTYRERRVALFERFGGPEVGALARRRFLEQVARATFEAFRRALATQPVELLRGLAGATHGRHLQVYSRDPASQKALMGMGVGGSAAAPPGADYLMAVGVNAGGNKLDAFLRRTLDWRVRLAADGSATATASLTGLTRWRGGERGRRSAGWVVAVLGG